METSSLLSPLPLLPPRPSRRNAVSARRPARSGVHVFAVGDRSAGGYGGRLVDEGMIVLRKRIHETKMVERNYEPPEEWSEWEKSLYTSYDSLVCEAVGILQGWLMETRPGVAVGVGVLLGISGPVSVLMVLFHLVESAKSILFLS